MLITMKICHHSLLKNSLLREGKKNAHYALLDGKSLSLAWIYILAASP